MVNINKLLNSPLFEQARTGKPVNILVGILLPPLIYVVMLFFGSMAVRMITRNLDGASSPLMASLVQNLHYIMFGLVILFIFAWVVLVEKRKISTLGLASRGGLKKYAVGMAVALVIYVVAVGIQAATGNISISLNSEAAGAMAIVGIALTFIGFIVQGGAEEVVFRGWQTPVIGARYGAIVGILISSVIFALLHIIAGATLSQVVLIFIVGIFLALYAVREGTIWGACGFHALWNWLSYNVLVQSGDSDTPSLVLFNLQPTGQFVDAIYILVFIVGITAILAASLKVNKKEKATPVKG